MVHNFLVEAVKFLLVLTRMLFLLLLLKLFEELLVCFKLKTGDHFILHPRLKLVFLLPLDHVHLFLDLAVFLLFQTLLLCQRCFNCCLDGRYML